MPVVPTQIEVAHDDHAIRFARYLAMIGYAECAGFGVTASGAPEEPACREIWTKAQRDQILSYLAEAQQEIEDFVRYPVQPTFIAGTASDSQQERFVDSQPVKRIIQARWGYVIAGGIRGEANISLGQAVVDTSDPEVIGPIATTVTDTSEVYVFHHGTDIEITPSKITISGGNLTIEMPRCRLVLPEYYNNPEVGWPYSDDTYFATEVDVKRIYVDDSTQAELVSAAYCAGDDCGDNIDTACIRVRDSRLGVLEVVPACYSDGEWVGKSSYDCWHSPHYVRLNYVAGLHTLSPQMEMAIVRLAHAKLPMEPCGCESAIAIWRGDRDVPGVLTRERFNCPFGINNGAWLAFQYVKQNMLVRASTLESKGRYRSGEGWG